MAAQNVPRVAHGSHDHVPLRTAMCVPRGHSFPTHLGAPLNSGRPEADVPQDKTPNGNVPEGLSNDQLRSLMMAPPPAPEHE